MSPQRPRIFEPFETPAAIMRRLELKVEQARLTNLKRTNTLLRKLADRHARASEFVRRRKTPGR